MKEFFKTYPFSTLITVVIIFLSMFNPPHTQLDKVDNIDKIAHFCMYGGLELVIWIEYLRKGKKNPGILTILAMLFIPIFLGVAMELAQSALTDYRSCEWADVIADSAGAFAGVLAGWLLNKTISGKR
ncbi:MAG: VanZ family protein [Bacteroidaceae bacterium]|nr:VanZ family protein [Bacteroidaceae bacterium]MBO7588548.1 VanZ family protein [Bacteroidaceae bacterium]MBP5645883.1 VanZ family protein [Bacteroidaceae bacterium]